MGHPVIIEGKEHTVFQIQLLRWFSSSWREVIILGTKYGCKKINSIICMSEQSLLEIQFQ